MDNKLLYQQLIGEKDSKPFMCRNYRRKKDGKMLSFKKKEEKSNFLKDFNNKFKVDKSPREINNFLIQYSEDNNIPYELKQKIRYNTLSLLGCESKSDIIEGLQTKKKKDRYLYLCILL